MEEHELINGKPNEQEAEKPQQQAHGISSVQPRGRHLRRFPSQGGDIVRKILVSPVLYRRLPNADRTCRATNSRTVGVL